MDLLQQGVEWLGHELIETTQVYLDANLELKQRVLDAVTPVNGKPSRYRPDDKLLAFLPEPVTTRTMSRPSSCSH